MDRKAVVAALAPALILYACDRAVMPADNTATSPALQKVGAVGTLGEDLPPSPPPPSDGSSDEATRHLPTTQRS